MPGHVLAGDRGAQPDGRDDVAHVAHVGGATTGVLLRFAERPDLCIHADRRLACGFLDLHRELLLGFGVFDAAEGFDARSGIVYEAADANFWYSIISNSVVH